MGHAKDQKASPNGREPVGPVRSSALTTSQMRRVDRARSSAINQIWCAAGQRLRHHLRAVDNVADFQPRKPLYTVRKENRSALDAQTAASELLTLYTTPVIYLTLDRLRVR